MSLANHHLFIEVRELAQAVDSGSTVIIDCRFALADVELGRRQYQEGHIPGARFLDLAKDLSGPVGMHGGRHPLPSAATLAERLRWAGVGSKSRVVVYDDSRLAFAARLWWLLRYLGHDEVRVLNGGYAAWKRAGLPVSTETPPQGGGDFSEKPMPELLVDRDQVLARLRARDESTRIVDARERKRFRGEHEPIDPVAGHIPTAVCYPWQDFTTAEGMVISDHDNRARWSAFDTATPVVVYCGSGVTACVDILSLHAAGFERVKLYGGSWSDWCSFADSPIAVGDDAPEP